MKVLKPITRHLKEEAFTAAATEFAKAIAKAKMDLSALAREQEIDRRTVGRWVETCTERGFDVMAQAERFSEAAGKDPDETLSHRIRKTIVDRK